LYAARNFLINKSIKDIGDPLLIAKCNCAIIIGKDFIEENLSKT
jgi:hypothetical protein